MINCITHAFAVKYISSIKRYLCTPHLRIGSLLGFCTGLSYWQILWALYSDYVIVSIDNLYSFDIVSLGGVKMLIQVKYPDNRYDYVKNNILDIMIESNNITEFKRSTGWVKIGVDPIRKTRRNNTYKEIFR